jgi:hypothetical protein
MALKGNVGCTFTSPSLFALPSKLLFCPYCSFPASAEKAIPEERCLCCVCACKARSAGAVVSQSRRAVRSDSCTRDHKPGGCRKMSLRHLLPSFSRLARKGPILACPGYVIVALLVLGRLLRLKRIYGDRQPDSWPALVLLGVLFIIPRLQFYALCV